MKEWMMMIYALGAPAAVVSTHVDCDYSLCAAPLTAQDCSYITSTCQSYGGVASCIVGDNEFECNYINLPNDELCTVNTGATICAGYSYGDLSTSCSLTEGDCDTSSIITSAPTSRSHSIFRIDCQYEACTLPLTANDCLSISNLCSSYGGTAFCLPGDNEFDCNNIAYTGSGVCADATARTQCMSYDYVGWTCPSVEGDCDDPILTTFAPTPAFNSGVRFDCEYDNCNRILTADDCQAITSACSAVGGVAFCAPHTNEFECNNVPWSGAGVCSDITATTVCASVPLSGLTCTSEGDCDEFGSSSEDDALSDSEKVVIAIIVPVGIVLLGCLVWFILSSRTKTNSPMAEDVEVPVAVVISSTKQNDM